MTFPIDVNPAESSLTWHTDLSRYDLTNIFINKLLKKLLNKLLFPANEVAKNLHNQDICCQNLHERVKFISSS